MEATPKNEALPLVKEVLETKDIREAARLLATDDWICLRIIPDKLFILGRIN